MAVAFRGNMYRRLFCTVILLNALSLQTACGNDKEDTWVQPDAWSQMQYPCPVCKQSVANTEEDVALLYFKKFLATLFNRKHMQYREHSDQYQGSLEFSLESSQLEKLEQLNDPRDLDSLLMEVMAKAHSGKIFDQCKSSSHANSSMNITAILTAIFQEVCEQFKSKEIQFMTLVASVILFGWFLHRRYNIGVVCLTLVGIFVFGYFITYLECNRKLEIDEIVEFMDKSRKSKKSSGWLSSVLNVFTTDGTNARVEELRKSREMKLRFCRPDHVLMTYVNDLLLKQFEVMFERFIHTIARLSSNLSWPFALALPFVGVLFIGFILKLTFKYILNPKGWAPLLHQQSQPQPNLPHHTHHTLSGMIAEDRGDRISGENLNLLLKALRPLNGVPTMPTPSFSGVEEILEPREISAGSSDDSFESGSSETSVNKQNRRAICSDCNAQKEKNVGPCMKVALVEKLKDE